MLIMARPAASSPRLQVDAGTADAPSSALVEGTSVPNQIGTSSYSSNLDIDEAIFWATLTDADFATIRTALKAHYSVLP